MDTKALIVDVSQMAYRVWNIFQNPKRSDLRNSKGEPTGMQFGSLRIIHAIVKDIKPDKIYFAWDEKPLDKYKVDSEYKAGRVGAGEGFYPGLTILKTFWESFGVTHVSSLGQEADDVVASIVAQLSGKGQSFILSSDDDFLQLVKNGRTIVVKPPLGKQPSIYVDEEYVKTNWGVEPALMPHLRALIGDKSDNLSGIPRFNTKKAADLIIKAGSVEELYRNLPSYESALSPVELEKLKAHKDQAFSNLCLMRMRCDLPLSVQEHTYNPELVKASLEAIESKSYLAKLQELGDSFTKRPRLIVGEDTAKCPVSS